jgi:hypothetical protein
MRPLRALAYAAGLSMAFSLPSVFFAVSHGFNLAAIGLVLGAFGLLVWIALMRPVFGPPLVARRTVQVLRVVIIARLLAALVPCGCVDLVSGALVVEVVTKTDLTEGGPRGIPPSDFVATTFITVGQGAILLIEFTLMAGVSYWVVRRNVREHNPDICLACGYDVRASREFGRCPECGTPCPASRMGLRASASSADEPGGG